MLSCSNPKHDDDDTVKATAIDTTKLVMTDTIKNDILERINISIESGFYNKDAIFTNVEDYLYEIPFDYNWTKQQIDKAFSGRLKEQSPGHQ